MKDQLKASIVAVIEGIRHLDVDAAADLLAEIGDDLSEGDRNDDVFVGAILDGIRWGYHAAVVVELGGGAMARFVMPGGVGITHEWARDADADQPIRDALAAIHGARGTAQGGGDD